MLRFIWLAVVPLSLLDAAAVQAAGKPNVVLIVGDDLNTNLGCYGHKLVQSPHIDRLAARGVRFERAYTNVPVCNPSRTTFLSGWRPGSPHKNAVFLPNHFSKNGYRTIEIGHVRHGYGISHDYAAFDENKKSIKDAIAFLGRKHDRPFLLAIGLSHTHPGFASTPPFQKLYPYDKMVLPKEPPNIKDGVPADAFHKLDVRAQTEAQHRKHLASYYAAVSTLDNEVGAVLESLDKLGLWDNTIVILTSDHGRMLGEHGGIFDKRCLFEQSVRIPFIVAAPGHKGKTSPRLVENVDIYPTLIELCGVPRLDGLQGLSVLPLLRDPQRPWRQAAFSHSPVHPGGVTMRTERYRYTEWGSPKLSELYDHDTDPQEHRNLVSDPAHAEVISAMRRMFAAGWKGALPK
jgi:iduronate 2-sulfatase